MANLSNINGKFVVEQTTGFVGIGTTDPAYLLHVNSSDIPNGTRIIIENTNGSGKKYGLISDNTGVFTVRDITAGADRFSISTLGNATFAGNVGIGTASPAEKLEISDTQASGGVELLLTNVGDGGTSTTPYTAIRSRLNSIRNGGEIRFGRDSNYGSADNADSNIQFYTALNDTNTERMRLDSSGNVGIGTASPQERLHIVGLDGSVPLSSYYGSLVVDNNGEAAMSIIGNSYSSIYFGDAATNFVGAINYQHSVNAMIFKTNDNTEKMRITSSAEGHVELSGTAPVIKATASNGGSGLRINIAGQTTGQLFRVQEDGTTKFQINENGNVGIGTTSPAQSLDTTGKIRVRDGGNTTIPSIQMGPSGIDGLSLPATNTIAFITNSTERMRIDSSGNVGIANSNPSGNVVGENGKSLIVGNESAANESASISIISGSNGYSYLLFGDGDGASGYQGQVRYQHSSNNLQFVTGANERMRIDSSGQVGIGTTSPTARLNVKASGSTVDQIAVTHSGNTVEIAQLGQSANGNSAGALLLKTNGGTDTVYLDAAGTSYINGGNVGIGTNSPSAKMTIISSGADGIQLGSDTSSVGNSGRLFFSNTSGGWAFMALGQTLSVRSSAIPGTTSGNPRVQLSNYSSTAWTASSDESLKENINSIGNVLDKINNYRCVEYNLIDDEDKDKKIGFIAQDWQKDFPQIVEQMEDEKIGMKYTETIPVLLKAIQELKAEIEILKNK